MLFWCSSLHVVVPRQGIDFRAQTGNRPENGHRLENAGNRCRDRLGVHVQCCTIHNINPAQGTRPVCEAEQTTHSKTLQETITPPVLYGLRNSGTIAVSGQCCCCLTFAFDQFGPDPRYPPQPYSRCVRLQRPPSCKIKNDTDDVNARPTKKPTTTFWPVLSCDERSSSTIYL